MVIAVGFAVRFKRKSKAKDYQTTHSSKHISSIDIQMESDFGDFVINYAELTLKTKIGEGNCSLIP